LAGRIMAPMPAKPTAALDANADTDARYAALSARDARFDGRFYVGVTSTGIYCRPVCKVRVPKRENCRFFDHAAQAEGAGFRPCLRCRPELAPQSLPWSIQDASATLALQAARLLDEPEGWGENGATPGKLARRLGVSDRHARRIFETQFGVSPLQYLQTRRLLTAKQFLADTRLPITQIALASGFSSLRRFNAAFLTRYRMTPTALRHRHGPSQEGAPAGCTGVCTVRLAYRPPYNVGSMIAFLHKRALPGIDDVAHIASNSIASDGYIARVSRTFYCLNGEKTYAGWLSAAFDETSHQVLLTVSESLLPVLPVVIRRTRHWLDLDADPQAIHQVLQKCFPQGEGLRVPGCMDGFELAVRAVLGQQITVAAARTLAERLASRFGSSVQTPLSGLTRLFPSAHALAQATPDEIGQLGIVKQRQTAIRALAHAVAAGSLQLHAGADVPATLAALKALPGIGDWTAHYIAMRALRWPDAFPAGDVALHKALGLGRWAASPDNDSISRVPTSAVQVARQAEALSQAWRPWRSYAVLRAWSLSG
jgi:AraC family transcriptional regulator, regulatory protein of adaptative response / DNA-3-methyladenine glycosylase II